MFLVSLPYLHALQEAYADYKKQDMWKTLIVISTSLIEALGCPDSLIKPYVV